MSQKKKAEKEFDKGDYLGVADTTKVADEIFFKIEDLTNLAHDDSVVNVVCSHCKNIFEVTQKGAESICNYSNILLPSSFEGKYFLASSCFKCQADKGNKIKSELKNISDLVS